MSEFDLINQYFNWKNTQAIGVVKSVGDDAAILDLPPNTQLVTSIDTLIEGVHFPENIPAEAIGHKALAVNLSDLAAMGATPAWFTLALTIPKIDKKWLAGFRSGLKPMADQYGCSLVGGDTTRGPLSISIQVMGWVETGKALLRSGASVGDKIYVTGTLGDAAIGLQSLQKGTELSSLNADDLAYCEGRLNYPSPRLKISKCLGNIASSCIDISDGLLQDLSHILKQSSVGAQLDTAALPLSAALQKLDKKQAVMAALTGGDDYELLFSVAPEKEQNLKALLLQEDQQINCIGVVIDKTAEILDQTGKSLLNHAATGYNHFHE